MSSDPTFFIFVQPCNSPVRITAKDCGIVHDCDNYGIISVCASMGGALLLVKDYLDRETAIEIPAQPLQFLVEPVPESWKDVKPLKSFTDGSEDIVTILFSESIFAEMVVAIGVETRKERL